MKPAGRLVQGITVKRTNDASNLQHFPYEVCDQNAVVFRVPDKRYDQGSGITIIAHPGKSS